MDDTRRNISVFAALMLVFLGILGVFGWSDRAQAAAPSTGEIVASQDWHAVESGSLPARVTGEDGVFQFEGLDRGTHKLYLDVSSLPAAFRPDPSASVPVLWLNPGQSLTSDPVAGGVRFAASYDADGTTISGTVFVDQDGDGQRSAMEVGLTGVTVVDPTIHQYFVPFNDDDLWTLFAEINSDDASIGQCLFNSVTSAELNSVVSLTSSADGTIYYYDHWEDGYDADPLQPASTTEVGMLDRGVTQIFASIVVTPRDPAAFYYDGRDRITIAGERGSVIRSVYPVQPDERLAGAWEVPEVSEWGQKYVSVIGEDLDFNGAGTDDFDYVGLQIMAAQSGTEIWYNGTPLTTTTEAGGTFLVDGANDGAGGGGVDSSDIITATGPIQVQMLGAGCDPSYPYSARAFTLQPRGAWVNEYWAPVPDFTDGGSCDIDLDGDGTDDRDTDIYVHNENPFTITVNFDDGPGPTVPFTIPGHTTISVLAGLGRDLSSTRGGHLSSNEPFWGVSVIDSTSGNSGSPGSEVNDWGYSLIPGPRLSSQVVLGWAPGNSLKPPTSNPADNSGNLAFVTAITDTVVYVDTLVDDRSGGTAVHSHVFDMNGDGDANDLDVFGNLNFDEPRSDEGVPLLAGEVLRVADPNDNDMTGAVIYTRDLSEKIAVAWGQDPCRSGRESPYLDMGYTVLATPLASLSKEAELAIDADLSQNISPGDVLTYTLIAHNAGLAPMFDAALTDTIPFTQTDFVVGSIFVSEPPMLGGIDYFNGSTGMWGYTPAPDAEGDDPAVHMIKFTWPVIEAQATITMTFRLRLDRDIPVNITEVVNSAEFCSLQTDCVSAVSITNIGRPALQIAKIDDPDPVRAGELLTYTVVVSNVGDGSALGILTFEDLPRFVTYVPDSLNLTLPSVLTDVVTSTIPFTTTFPGIYGDDFDRTITQTTGYTGSDGSFDWATPWMEIGDPGVGPDAGDVQVGSVVADSLSPPGYLELTNSLPGVSGAARAVDLSDFVSPTLRFYVSGANSPGDSFSVTAGSDLLLSETYDGFYNRRNLDLGAYAGSTVTFTVEAGAGLQPGQAYRFDNFRVTESSPLRTGTRILRVVNSVLTYTTQTGINPVAIDPVTNMMTVTDKVRIPAGAQVRFTFQVRVTEPLTNGFVLENVAAITSTNILTNPYPLQDTEDTTVLSSHALTITKQGSPPVVHIGELITYTLLWEVGGDEPAPGVVVTDTIPVPYVGFVSCAGGLGCTFTAPDTIVWELGNRLPVASGVLHDGGVLTVTVRAVDAPPGGIITNTAVIDDDTDTPGDEDDETTEIINAGFVLTKRRTVPITGTARINDPVQFQIVITNTGALSITVLPLTDTYDPVYLEFQEAVPAPDSTSPGTVVWDDLITTLSSGPLLPDASVSVTLTFTAISSTQQLNPPVTVDVARSEGAQTVAGPLPPIEDPADVGISLPTAIELLYFRATPRGTGVLVEWSTLFEIETYGFRLYRSPDDSVAGAEPIAFVPAKGGSDAGAVYQYLDADLRPAQYRYWLVEVETSGHETWYGPVSAWLQGSPKDLPQQVYLPVVLK
jgi:uncharacterized repeat protein (TIGR01451 family)